MPRRCTIFDPRTRDLTCLFDRSTAGSAAPKFPHPLDLRLLLRLWRHDRRDETLDMVRLTLDKMAAGGIYDHLGGGFHRYSVDDHWLVPHFEKMLYDNALLASCYVEAFQATGESRLRPRRARNVRLRAARNVRSGRRISQHPRRGQ